MEGIPAQEQALRDALRRCSQETVEAALRYRANGDPAECPTIVLGILERFLEPEQRPQLQSQDPGLDLAGDLGLDSLLMVEVVILVEEVLQVSVANEELRHLRTLGDLQAYIDAKVRGLPLPEPTALLGPEHIAALLPHQPPFLFLDEARVNTTSAEGHYHVTGNEQFLEGHFKGHPVFPASLMLEALGQLAVLLVLKNPPEGIEAVGDPRALYFLGADGIRCTRLVHPGDTLHLRVQLKRVHLPLAQFEGSIQVGGQKAARVETFSLNVPAPDARAEGTTLHTPATQPLARAEG